MCENTVCIQALMTGHFTLLLDCSTSRRGGKKGSIIVNKNAQLHIYWFYFLWIEVLNGFYFVSPKMLV